MTSKQYLAAIRRAAMQSQATLAYHLGVSQQVISSWELGQTVIPYYRVKAICEITGGDEATMKELLNAERPG